MEPREVQWPVRPQLFRNPGAHAADGVEVVGVGRHDEVDDLEPHAQFLERLERVEDGLELAGVELLIGVLVETLQVHVRGVHELIQVARGPLLDRAAAHDDVLELPLARGFCRYPGCIRKTPSARNRCRKWTGNRALRSPRRRLRGTNSAAKLFERKARRQRRTQAQLLAARVLGFFRFLLRNLPVLAVEAAEDATGRGE